MPGYNFIELGTNPFTIAAGRVIALQQDGKDKLKNAYNALKTNKAAIASQDQLVEEPAVPEVPQEVENLDIVEQPVQPAVDISTNSAPADFQPAPESLNPNTPIEDMIAPFDMNAQAQPTVEPVAVPAVDTPPAVNEPAPVNVLSDAEFIKEFENLVNRTGIRQQTIKEQMRRRLEDLLMQAKNMDYIEDKVNEMADVVKATNEVVKASNNLNQSIQNQPVNPTPTTPIQPTVQNPTLNLQQAA